MRATAQSLDGLIVYTIMRVDLDVPIYQARRCAWKCAQDLTKADPPPVGLDEIARAVAGWLGRVPTPRDPGRPGG